jgi:Ser/Thr protein kinase RdoA (MazF antagonist)
MNQFVPEPAIVNYVEEEYALGAVRSIELVRSSQNDVYKMRTSKGDFAVKIYLSNRPDITDVKSIAQQHLFTQKLREAGIRAEEPVESRNRQTYGLVKRENEDRYLCIYRWINGEIGSNEMPEDRYEAIGRVHARLVSVGESLFPLQHRATLNARNLARIPAEIVESAILECGEVDCSSLLAAIHSVVDMIARFDDTKLCNTVVHGDLNPSNMIFDNNGLVLIDFDNCCNACPLWDEAVLRACFTEEHMHTILTATSKCCIYEPVPRDFQVAYKKAMSIWKFAYILRLSEIKRRGVAYNRGMNYHEVRRNSIDSWIKYLNKELDPGN